MRGFSRIENLPALLLLAGFGLTWGVLAFLLHQNWQYKQDRFLAQHASVVATAYHARVEGYALATKILVAESVRRPEVIATFARGVDGDPAARATANVKAIEFITGYLIEKALAVDNIFVFLLVFTYFAVVATIQGERLKGKNISPLQFVRSGSSFCHPGINTAKLFRHN